MITPQFAADGGSGLLYVDKPAGLTSHDVVARVRRAARTSRVGHAGTLDPFATGLLVVAVGGTTRLLRYIAAEPKVYEASFRFGSETDTDDRTGTVIREAALPHESVLLNPLSETRLKAESDLTGLIQQRPPQYSAKLVAGRRAYSEARKGREVDLTPVTVMVHKWEWLSASNDTLEVRITCAGGTYIRALARDMGRALDTAAHCRELRRVSSGPAQVADAVSMEHLTPGAIADGRLALRSALELLEPIPRQELSIDDADALRFGRAIPSRVPGNQAVLVFEGEVAAVAVRTDDNRWQPRVMLLGAST